MSNLHLFAACVLIWGSTWIAITFQLGKVAPDVSVFYRFLLASGMVFAYCRWKKLPLRYTAKEHAWIALMGVLMFSVSYIFVYYAEEHVVSGLVAVLIGAVLGGAAQYWWWALAILLDLLAAGVGGQREGWNLHPDHFVERHGLIVIIALGETLIVAAAGLADAPRTADAIATAILAVAVTGGLWWTYFGHARVTFEHALAAAEGNARSRLARDTFSVLHFPMLCGVIAMSAATEEALAHPHEPLTFGVRVALGAGVVLFVCGAAAAIWRATGRLLVWRLVLAPAFAVIVTTAAGAPWLSMGVVLAMLIAIAAVEQGEAQATSHAA